MARIKTWAGHLYTGYAIPKAVLLVAVAALYLVLVAYGGGNVAAFLLFAVAVAGYIVLPGLLGVQLLGRTRLPAAITGFELPTALLLGSGFFAVLYCFSMRLGLLWLLHGLPPFLALFYLVLLVRRQGLPRPSRAGLAAAAPKPHQWMLLLLFAALLLLYTFTGVVKNAHPLNVGDTLLNQDLLWNVGNANSFKLAFPPQDIRFYDVRLHYHYLTELLAGALSIVSGIDAYDILAFYLQPLMLAALVLCLYRFGRLMWPHSLFKAVFFPYSLFLFSCASLWKILPNGLSVFWNSHITHLITNINSQTTAVLYLAIFCGLFIRAARAKYRTGAVHLLLVLCAFVLLCFSKGPLAALLTISLVLALLVGLFLRQTGWRGLLLAGAFAGIFLLVYFTMFASGANTSMNFNWTKTLEMGYFVNILDHLWRSNLYAHHIAIPVLYVLQSLLMAPAQFPLYLRGLAFDLRHFNKLQPERLFFNAMVVGGLLAYFLFYHPAMSQTYFLFGALFFITLLAVDNLRFLAAPGAAAQRWKRIAHRVFVGIVALFALVGFATTAFLYTNLIGSGARQLARNIGLTEKYPYDVVVTADDEAAMLWLRDNTDPTIMFATNRIHTGARKEGISNLYSALSGRQGYMEGFQYALTNMGVAIPVIEERLAINEALFSADTTPADVAALCHENGITHLIFSTQMDGSDTQLEHLPCLYRSNSIRLYQVP
ncbi:MAG: hypothetical protein AB7V55_04610 [Oscillospiraceae bacterium]